MPSDHGGPTQPIMRALDLLAAEGFTTYLELVPGGWMLRWVRKGARWHARAEQIGKLAPLVFGWVNARATGDGREERWASHGEGDS